MLNFQAYLLSQVDHLQLFCLELDKYPKNGIKVNKEPAQENLIKEFLDGKENNIDIPQGVVPGNLNDFHLLPCYRWESSGVLSAWKREGILKALHATGA